MWQENAKKLADAPKRKKIVEKAEAMAHAQDEAKRELYLAQASIIHRENDARRDLKVGWVGVMSEVGMAGERCV